MEKMKGGMSVPWGDGCSRGMGVPGGMSVPGGWEFQGDECSRGMSVLGDGCLGGWEFLLPFRVKSLALQPLSAGNSAEFSQA